MLGLIIFKGSRRYYYYSADIIIISQAYITAALRAANRTLLKAEAYITAAQGLTLWTLFKADANEAPKNIPILSSIIQIRPGLMLGQGSQ